MFLDNTLDVEEFTFAVDMGFFKLAFILELIALFDCLNMLL